MPGSALGAYGFGRCGRPTRKNGRPCQASAMTPGGPCKFHGGHLAKRGKKAQTNKAQAALKTLMSPNEGDVTEEDKE